MDRFIEVAMWGLLAIVISILALGIWGLIESAPVLDEGIVIDKWHEPESRSYMFRKIGNVSQMVPIVDDEDWVLRVEGITVDGKKRVENWQVSRETYDQAAVGDRVTR